MASLAMRYRVVYTIRHLYDTSTTALMNDRTERPEPGEATGSQPDAGARREAMAVLAVATAAEIAAGLDAIDGLPGASAVRPVETGLVMVRGRIGGDGAPFNLGEATVTRAAVQLESGEIGLAYGLGRDAEKARLAALCDALWQSPRFRPSVEQQVLVPVRARRDGERGRMRAQAAATRVDFFTMVRGED